MATITVNGVQLAYDEVGDGPPVVWVHGGWTDRQDADLVVPLLADDYRVIVYDRRGHSQSERPPGHQPVSAHVSDLGALVEGLGAVPAHLVTNSFGGEIALKLALEQPAVVASLCLHEPGLFGVLGDDPESKQVLEDLQPRFGAVLADIERGDHEAAARRFMDTVVMGPGGWETLPEQMRETFAYNAPTVLNDFHDPALGVVDLDQLAGLTVPVLLTEGGRSEPWATAVLGRLADALPHARRHVYPQAGHFPELTHPNELAEAVQGFLESVVDTRS